MSQGISFGFINNSWFFYYQYSVGYISKLYSVYICLPKYNITLKSIEISSKNKTVAVYTNLNKLW